MYSRKTESGHIVRWNPDDEDLGQKSMQEIVGDVGERIDQKTAQDVRLKYQNLHIEKHGSESQFYESDSDE